MIVFLGKCALQFVIEHKQWIWTLLIVNKTVFDLQDSLLICAESSCTFCWLLREDELSAGSIPYPGCEIRTGPYGPTGITGNRSSMRVFNSQEPAYTRKAINRANRGQTSRVWKPLTVLTVQIWILFLELTTIVDASNHHVMLLDL